MADDILSGNIHGGSGGEKKKPTGPVTYRVGKGADVWPRGRMSRSDKITMALVAAIFAVGGIGAIVTVSGNSDRADDAAIARAVTCVLSKANVTDYGDELMGRAYGERMFRQLLIDLKAHRPDLPAELNRAALIMSACKGAPDYDPAPLPLVTK